MNNPHIFPTKKETIEHFKEMLSTRDEWAVRGLFRIYELQTDYEKSVDSTKESNGIGFNAVDATLLTSFVKQMQKHKGYLSTRQKMILKQRMPKYANQLYNISMIKSGDSK